MTAGLASGVGATSGQGRPTVPWLKDITVVALGRSPSSDVAARVLRQLGAQVTTSEADTDTHGADIVLVDRIAGPGPSSVGATAAEYVQHVAEQNRSVWVTASAYGLSTSRADAYASDLTLLASAGILGHARIGEEWAPTVPPGRLALHLVGYVMAVAALHGVHTRRAGAAPVHIDVSAQGAVIATGLTLEMAHALSDCPDEGGSARYGAPSGFFDCLDGSVYVLVLEQHQWKAFQTTLAPALDSVETLADARERADYVNKCLAEWTSTRTAEECERTLQAAGVPCTEVNSLEVFAERAHAVGRHLELAGADAPPLPAEVREVPTQAGGEPRASVIPLANLRVLDAGHVLAVPLGAAWLGAMGAEVTKLEDLHRLDIYRRRGPFAEGVPGPNRSAYFNQLNFCKTGLDVAVGDPGAAVDVGEFDVVLQNLTPRRARTVGVDAATVLATGSPSLAISSSGFGGSGAWSNYRAYGHNIHAFAGLVAATRDARGEMGDLGTPWADPLTSVAIAAWVLAWSLTPARSSSVAVDISMAELTAAQIAELTGVEPAAAYAAPASGGDFFVRLTSGQLLAVSLRDDQEVSRFEAVIDRQLPPITVKGQLVDVGQLDHDVVDTLLEAGLAVAVVMTAPQLVADDFLNSTGLFRTVESRALGRYRVTGLPWQFVGGPELELRAAPERPETEVV